MAYDRYPAREQRSNRPQAIPDRDYGAPDNYRDYGGQPASRTRFYRDKENGKLMGVCAGLADHFGGDPLVWRLIFVAGACVSVGTFGLIYLAIGLLAD